MLYITYTYFICCRPCGCRPRAGLGACGCERGTTKIVIIIMIVIIIVLMIVIMIIMIIIMIIVNIVDTARF